MIDGLEKFRDFVQAALKEDIGAGDATTESTIPADATALAQLVAREPLVISGLELARIAFLERSATLQIDQAMEDGERVAAGEKVLTIRGSARAILEAERVALNFVQHLSGIATLTRRYVDVVQGTNAVIIDTRKTLPGWRALDKYAVRCGGAQNHRQGLYDMILIKDNHLAVLARSSSDPINVAVLSARTKFPELKIEVEADNLDQVRQAAEAGADYILLDNMRPEILREAVQIVARRAKTEASGGVNLETVRAIAETGVDFISVGAITHSARAVDLALDFELK